MTVMNIIVHLHRSRKKERKIIIFLLAIDSSVVDWHVETTEIKQKLLSSLPILIIIHKVCYVYDMYSLFIDLYSLGMFSDLECFSGIFT